MFCRMPTYKQRFPVYVKIPDQLHSHALFYISMNSTIWQTKGSITSANGQMVNLVTFNDKSMQIILLSLFSAHHIHTDV